MLLWQTLPTPVKSESPARFCANVPAGSSYFPTQKPVAASTLLPAQINHGIIIYAASPCGLALSAKLYNIMPLSIRHVAGVCMAQCWPAYMCVLSCSWSAAEAMLVGLDSTGIASSAGSR